MSNRENRPGEKGRIASIDVARSVRRESARPLTRVMSFTSGKGGVGKSTVVLNMALALAQLGKSVLVLDADFGLANIDVMLGQKPGKTLHDLLEGTCTLSDTLISGPLGISIIPAASGIERMGSLSMAERRLLIEAVEEVAWHYDYLLIDTQAGIGPDVLHLNSAASEVVVVINDQPTSLTDAYALLKILSTNYGERHLSVVANNVPTEVEGIRAFQKLQRAVERFLQIHLNYLGSVPSDPAVGEAIMAQRPFVLEYPSASAARAIGTISRKIDQDFMGFRVKGGMQFFFRQLLEMRENGLN